MDESIFEKVAATRFYVHGIWKRAMRTLDQPLRLQCLWSGILRRSCRQESHVQLQAKAKDQSAGGETHAAAADTPAAAVVTMAPES
mmetsp:Transcript_4013/g.5306  ORF Transcript_4013/g.5306 Transcript_4013/m.5306 type:complete len:86 (-) Transcript_4013:86-343(-)